MNKKEQVVEKSFYIIIISTLFLIFNFSIFLILDNSILVKISFFVSACITELGIFKNLNKIVDTDIITNIFGFFFFVFAPIIQISSGRFPNYILINEENIVMVNIMIISWFTIYNFIPKKNNLKSLSGNNSDPNIRRIYGIISIFLFVLYFAKYKFSFFLGQIPSDENQNQVIQLLLNSLIVNVIYYNFIINFSVFKSSKKTFKSAAITFISLLIGIYFISPFNRSRFYLAFVLIYFLLKFYREKISGFKFFMILTIGLLFIFPTLDLFRQGYANFTFEQAKLAIESQFNKLHFDSYASFLADREFVNLNGFQYGLTIISALLFFIPSSVASWKIGGGALIGDYLSKFTWFGFYIPNFSNVSNPLLGEIFLNFGWIGILISPFILLWIKNKFFSTQDARYILIGFIFFLLRGDVLAAFSNMIASMAVIIFIPDFLKKISRNTQR